MKSSLLFGALLAFASSCAAADDKKKTPPLNPCTIRSPAGNFFDLRPLTRETPKSDAKTKDTTPVKSWTAIGHDYGANFTLNICGPVVEELHDVEGVDKDLYKNISAYYIKDRNTYSIGYTISTPLSSEANYLCSDQNDPNWYSAGGSSF